MIPTDVTSDAPLRPGPRVPGDDDRVDATDEEAPWVPPPGQTEALGDTVRDNFNGYVALGGFLILAGLLFQAEPRGDPLTIEGATFVLVFAGLFVTWVGSASGYRPVFAAGCVMLLGVLVQLVFWPGPPPLWSSLAFGVVGATILVVFLVLRAVTPSPDAGD